MHECKCSFTKTRMPNTRPKLPGTRSVGAFCAVYGCSNYMGKTRHLGISYHSFPRDPELRKSWIKKCRRADKWNPAKSYICSEHFDPNDFKRDFKAELMQCRKINKLISGAVPSVNLPQSRTTKAVSSDIEVTPRCRKVIDETLEEDIGEREIRGISQASSTTTSTTTGSHQLSLFEIYSSESELFDNIDSQVVCAEIVVSESSETEMSEEEDFTLKSAFKSLKHPAKRTDDGIIILDQAMNFVPEEK